jgi:hypothetical protein
MVVRRHGPDIVPVVGSKNIPDIHFVWEGRASGLTDTPSPVGTGVAGAVYTPEAVAEPPPACTTDQVTALFEALCTVAMNVNDDPVFSTADGPTTVTVTGGEGGEDGTATRPPPQPGRHAAAKSKTPRFACGAYHHTQSRAFRTSL